MKVSYCYRFQAPDSLCYDVSWTEFRNEQLENYNWNYLDQYICTRGEGEYGLLEVSVPCQSTKSKTTILKDFLKASVFVNEPE